MDLEPDETLIWTGQPRRIGYAVRRSIPQASAGLVMIAVWIALMVWNASARPEGDGRGLHLGERNFPLIVISVPLLLTGSYLATMPLRLARRLAGTRYLLSDHRAVIIAPDRPGNWVMHEYLPDDLALMHCEERPDGSGSLIFEDRPTWAGIREPAGFLGIDQVREVESLIRRTLAPGRRGPAAVATDDGFADVGKAKATDDLVPDRTYRLSIYHRAAIRVLGVGFPVAGVMLPIGLLIGLIAHLAGWLPWRLDSETTTLWIVSIVLLSLPLWLLVHSVSQTPYEIELDEVQRAIWLRGIWRSRVVPIAEIRSVMTGGWLDPQCSQVHIRLKNEKLCLPNDFDNFRDLLMHLKALNPSVEVKGF
ncbi:MAG: hypothetical protein ACYC61_21615 [Isosphaeraceae bacterium]